jgi:hypothetical protein
MNTFFEVYNEFGINLCTRLRDAGFGMQRFQERKKKIIEISRTPLQRRIFRRGLDEQYRNKYLPNYVGSKRLRKEYRNTRYPIALVW